MASVDDNSVVDSNVIAAPVGGLGVNDAANGNDGDDNNDNHGDNSDGDDVSEPASPRVPAIPAAVQHQQVNFPFQFATLNCGAAGVQRAGMAGVLTGLMRRENLGLLGLTETRINYTLGPMVLAKGCKMHLSDQRKKKGPHTARGVGFLVPDFLESVFSLREEFLDENLPDVLVGSMLPNIPFGLSDGSNVAFHNRVSFVLCYLPPAGSITGRRRITRKDRREKLSLIVKQLHDLGDTVI